MISTAGTYPTFAYFARGHCCRLVELAYQEGPGLLAPNLDALPEPAHREGAKLVYLANPDNPSGHVHNDKDVLAFRQSLPKDC